MAALVIKRLGYLVITLWLLSLFVFAITQILPGDVARMILGPYVTDETLRALGQQLGLDRPPLAQYGDWLVRFVSGNWGTSLRMGLPVRDVLLPNLANSLYLGAFALLGVSIFGIGFGVLAGLKQGTMVDAILSTLSFAGISLPSFVLGSILIILFAGGWLKLFPGSGYATPTEDPVDWFMHLVLPGVTLMLMLLAYVLRMTRSGIIEVLQANYIRTARLKGMPERQVIWKHALRNALMPTVTIIAMNIGWLIGSVVVVEEVFAYPGLGRLLVFAVNNRDLPLIQACVMVIGVATGLASMAADILYTILDPRIRYTRT